MPTGIALRDARDQLFAAAERVVERGGPSALTSRSVTAESGLAKGVLHRYFDDFDSFLAAFVAIRITSLRSTYDDLAAAVGRASVVSNVTSALVDALTPVNLAAIAIATSRATVRAALQDATPRGVPVLFQLGNGLAAYLQAERRGGRLIPSADDSALGFALVATAHLVFLGEPGGLPDRSAVEEVVESMLVEVLPRTTEA